MTVRETDQTASLPARRAVVIPIALLLLVFAGLFAIRFARNEPVNGFTGGTTYRQIADNLVEFGAYSVDGRHPTGYRPPLYPLLLAGIRYLTGDAAQTIGLAANLALDLSCLALLLSLVFRVSRSRTALLVAGLLFATDLAFHLEAMAQRETMLYAALLLAFMTAAAQRTIALPALLTMTVAAALAWLTRPTGIALVPLLAIAAFFLTDLRGYGHRIARLLTAAFVFASIVLPWQAFLYRSFGEPVISGTTSGGLNLFQGNNPAADVLIPFVDVDAYLPAIDDRLAARGFAEHDELGRDRSLKQEAVAYIRAEPIGFLRRAAVKTLALWSPVPTPLGSGRIDATAGNVVLQDFRYSRSLWTIVISAHGLVVLVMIFAALGGRRILLARRPRAVFLMLGYLLLATALHSMTFAETRFRMPLDPLVFALVATALFGRGDARTTYLSRPIPR